MKYVQILTLLLLQTMAVNSQTWAWATSCPGTSGYGSDAISVSADPAANVFITGSYGGTMTLGSYTLNGSVNGSAYLIKYDSNGNVLWAKTPLSPTTFTYSCYGISVCSDAGGNALVTGPGYDVNYKSNSFLIKYDPSGNVLWALSSSDTSYNFPFSVSCDAGNNVYLSGVFKTSVAFGTTTLTGVGSKNLFLVKFDPNGNVIWARKNSSGDLQLDWETGTTVSAEPNGNVFVAGGFTSPTLVLGTYTLTNSGYQNIFLAKYDTNGNVLWAKSAIGTTSDCACSVSADGIGNAYITGYYQSPTLTFGTNSITNPGTQNMFLAKYDSIGNNLWVKNSIDVSMFTKGYSVSSNSVAVFVAGSTPSVLTIGTNTFSPPTPGMSWVAFITKFDVNGNLVYGQVLDDGGDDWFAVSADKFCNVYVSGDFDIAPFSIGSNSLTALPAGNENTFTAKLSFPSLCVNGINDIPKLNTENRIYPNPNSGQFNLQIENKVENGKLILYNSFGQQIHQQEVKQGVNEIHTTGLSSGLYHYIILQNKESIYTGKIMIECSK